jgi:hypothetical protein
VRVLSQLFYFTSSTLFSIPSCVEVFAQGPSYYAEEATITEIFVVSTALETTISVPNSVTTLKQKQSVIPAAGVPTASVSIIGTSSFTLTETFTVGATCSFTFSTPSAQATGSATPVPVPIGECVGQGVGFQFAPSATVSPVTYTQSMFGRPMTTVVFDVATLSQDSGKSNGGRRPQGAVSMRLFPLLLVVMGVVLGGGMVLI